MPILRRCHTWATFATEWIIIPHFSHECNYLSILFFVMVQLFAVSNREPMGPFWKVIVIKSREQEQLMVDRLTAMSFPSFESIEELLQLMMTSSNENIFRVTGPLCGELTGHWWIPCTVTRSFEVFFDLRLNKRLSKQSRGWWFATPPRPYDVTEVYTLFSFELLFRVGGRAWTIKTFQCNESTIGSNARLLWC